MLILVCYDIHDDRRRARVAKRLEGYGERVQGSVFECHLDATHLGTLQRDLSRLIDPEDDRLRYYRFCAKDVRLIQILGRGALPRDPGDILI